MKFLIELFSDADSAVRSFIEYRRWHYGLSAGALSGFSLWLAALVSFFRPVLSFRFAVMLIVPLLLFMVILTIITAFMFHFAAALSGAKGEILDLFFLLPAASCPFIASVPLALVSLFAGRFAAAVFFIFFSAEAILSLKLLFSILSSYYELDVRKTACVLFFPAIFWMTAVSLCAAAAVFTALIR